MKRLALVATSLAALAAVAVVSLALAGSGNQNIKAKQLIGYAETPAVSSAGTGTFTARLDEDARTIEYTESYSALEGSVAQSHIHFGQRSLTGGISVFLCTNLGNAPAGTTVQACPAAPATISGTIRPADVTGPAGQGIAAGEFDELVAAIRSGNTYVNVHSSKFPGGEIRAPLVDRSEDD
jgi:hypothetical protein